MHCPACKTKRCTPISLEEKLKATACTACGGLWISHRSYAAWLKHLSEAPPEAPFSDFVFSVSDAQGAKLCPDCSRILLKYKVGHGLDFFVDHCSGCGGIWLDQNEWSALKSKNLHDDIHKFFSTPWQSRVRGEKMASMLEQVYVSRFGAGPYERTKDFREWLLDQPQKKAILAFLSDEDPYKI